MVAQDSRGVLPVLADGDAPPQAGSWAGARPGRASARWQLRNWRMRWRVLALVLVPTVAALTLGTLRVQAAQNTAAAASRTAQLGVLGADITALAEAVQDERDLSAGYVAARLAGKMPESASIFGQLRRQYAVTGSRLGTVAGLAGRIGQAYPAAARADLASALSALSALTELRGLAHSEMATLPLISHYSSLIAALLAFDNDIAAGSSSAQLAQTVTSLESLAQVGEETSQQRAVLYAALIEGHFESGALTALTGAQSSQASAFASFQKEAANLPAYVPPAGLSPVLTESQQFNDIVAGPGVDAALATELDAIVSGGSGQQLGDGAQAWFGDMSFTLSAMRGVTGDELASAIAQADAVRAGAQNSEQLTAAAVLVLLILVLVVTIVMARSMILPLRKLRADALDVAGHRLPAMVRRLSESQGTDESIQLDPIGIDSTDEIGEVARAFDRVHSEAARLAGDEALLRANLNAMFVNLSRRSQSLIERQLGIIESLEQSEQDPGRLASLFRLDHLATRMRRNSENLLVLAGHEAPRKWTQPVPLVDVLRAAVSEIEQYERITLNVQSGLVVAGRAASDVVHLAAELVENATTFSREDTRVFVTGQLLGSGGVLIEITDEGLGIPEQELAYANWRLDNPPVIDVAVSRRMGLFVVGRLAARHGIKVRLRRAQGGGLSALIWVPETVAETEQTTPLGALRRFESIGHPGLLTAPASTAPVSTAPVSTAPVSTAPVPRRTVNSSWFAAQQGAAAATGPIPVAVPAAEPEPDAASAASGPARRLPIYDSVESDWFRRSGKPFSADGQPADGSWTSPADEGFRAAQAVISPTAGQLTDAGLPKRVPSANLVPGSISERPAGQQPGQPGPAGQAGPAGPAGPAGQATGPAGPPARSPEAARARLTGFQLRGREGRADASRTSGASGASGADEH